ncbi:MAG: twin-arginine translocase TatA/TatE family subunit [Candidatus Limnocylindrales bacterium]
MPFNVGPMELIIVLVIALLILGPGKLPEVGAAFGKTIREFRKASTDIQESTNLATSPSAPAAPPAPAAPVAPAPNTLSDAVAPNSLSAEPAPLGTPADPVEDRA